ILIFNGTTYRASGGLGGQGGRYNGSTIPGGGVGGNGEPKGENADNDATAGSAHGGAGGNSGSTYGGSGGKGGSGSFNTAAGNGIAGTKGYVTIQWTGFETP
ncbi:MAG: hypothetical protein JW874_12210, partial [Spirochaetales bacterium]|nr:hypothetical protein [Spirochaetales bacterium]